MLFTKAGVRRKQSLVKTDFLFFKMKKFCISVAPQCRYI